jgi:hypothetical protein
MLETLYWVGFGAVIALGVFWLAAKWFKEPREGKWFK